MSGATAGATRDGIIASRLPTFALVAAPASAGVDIRIAGAVPRAGPVAITGDQVSVGAQEAAKAVDAEGGVDGRNDAEGITYEIDVWKNGAYGRFG